MEAGMSDSGGLNGAGGRLSGAEVTELTRQIAGLAQAGLPLAHGLVALGEELPRGRLRRSMNQLAMALESGVTLDQALESQKNRIPPHLRGLVIAGLRSGRLGDVLSRFSQYVSVGTDLKRRLWLSLAYPILTVCIALGLFFFVCVIMVSQFDEIYRGFGIPLPRLTLMLMAAARIANRAWLPLLIVGGTILVCWLAARLFLSPPRRRSLAGRLPLVGTVWRATSLAEFCHLLALLLESHLPLPEALRLTGEGVQDFDVDASCKLMANQVETGRTLSQAMGKGRQFPRGLPRLVAWAEQQKSLPEVLHMAGEMFESRARSYSTFVGAVLNVVCVLLVFFMIMVVPALFIPLITLISRLSG
jgi:type II secretory pathway component PulF